MGLPVLTLSPPVPIAMQTYSGNTLKLVGMDDCIASSASDLVDLATHWIQHPAVIETLRHRARGALSNSPFMDHPGRVRELEACFLEMWKRFEAGAPVTHIDSETVVSSG